MVEENRLSERKEASSSSPWGPFASLSSWKEKLIEFQDEQQMERLRKCLELDELLKQCRNKHSDSPDDPLETMSPGLRTMKYYGWRGILKRENIDPLIHQHIQSSCSREQHAVWACRAVATGCGYELSMLKTCFDNHNNEYDILTTPITRYDSPEQPPSTSSSAPLRQVPCEDAQRILGTCVTANAKKLLQRKQQR
jgi:hypothetical protein